MGNLKGTCELICPRCGKSHIVEADYFTPGIRGTIVNSKGVPVTFVDPTEPHFCDACIEELLNEIIAAGDSKKDLDI